MSVKLSEELEEFLLVCLIDADALVGYNEDELL